MIINQFQDVKGVHGLIRNERANYVPCLAQHYERHAQRWELRGSRITSSAAHNSRVARNRAIRWPCSEFEVEASVPAPFPSGDNLVYTWCDAKAMQRATTQSTPRIIQIMDLVPCCSGRTGTRPLICGLIPLQVTWQANQCLASNRSEHVGDHRKSYQHRKLNMSR